MLLDEAKALHNRLVDIRRAIHRQPELGMETDNTARLVERELDLLGISHRRFAGTGVAGHLGSHLPGLALVLRADMDALPIHEDNDLPFKSELAGRMHACGHDAHTAVVLGAASLLKMHEQQLSSPVTVVFQPAEEGPGGALPMIEAGVLDQPRAGAAMMIHADPDCPVGSVAFKSGYATANIDDFVLTVHGRSGHGAHPDTGVDALVVASQIVVAAQTLVSRMTDPIESAVVTFGTIHGGWRENVLADRVELTGTLRTLSTRRRTDIEREFRRLATHIADAYGARIDLDVEHGYPALYCDEGLTALAVTAAKEMLGTDCTMVLPNPWMGGEDFAYFAQRVPGTYCHLGVSRPDQLGHNALHSAQFLLDERCLSIGAAVLANLALNGVGDVAKRLA